MPVAPPCEGAARLSRASKRFPYKKIGRDKVKLPKRSHKDSYNDQASLRGMKFVEERY